MNTYGGIFTVNVRIRVKTNKHIYMCYCILLCAELCDEIRVVLLQCGVFVCGVTSCENFKSKFDD